MRYAGVGLVLLAAGILAEGGTAHVDLRVPDGRTADPRRRCHDVSELRLRIAGGEIIVDVTMAKPFRETMFLDAHIEFDADDKKGTGFEGFDFGVHAFAGSRYRRNAAGDALERRGTVLKYVKRETRKSFVHTARMGFAPPVIDGNRLQFRFPLAVLKEHGLRYNNTVRWRFWTRSSVSEHPLSTEYVCRDEGVPVEVDGQLKDWPPVGVRVEDQAGELHPDATEIDITSLQVEHDAAAVFALVRVQRSGFATPSGRDDVQVDDRIVVCLEPVGARAYMEFAEAEARTGSRTGQGPDHRHACGDRFVEFAFARKPEQGKFRVLAYADARRYDRVPDSGASKLVIPKEAWKDGE